jgi:hypothetical protein
MIERMLDLQEALVCRISSSRPRSRREGQAGKQGKQQSKTQPAAPPFAHFRTEADPDRLHNGEPYAKGIDQ